MKDDEKPYDVVVEMKERGGGRKGGGLTFLFMSKPKITNLGLRMKVYVGWVNHVISKKTQFRLKGRLVRFIIIYKEREKREKREI